MLPRRREQGLLLERLSDETVVYDTRRHEAHCLDQVSSLVWEHCDGRTSPADMVELIRTELGHSVDETTVQLVLELLEGINLLVEQRPARPAAPARSTRRRAARRLALLGLTGVVMTIPVPAPAAAASGVPDGGACSASIQCKSGCCCQDNSGGNINTCQPIGGCGGNNKCS